jgi:hypothetical protein
MLNLTQLSGFATQSSQTEVFSRLRFETPTFTDDFGIVWGDGSEIPSISTGGGPDGSNCLDVGQTMLGAFPKTNNSEEDPLEPSWHFPANVAYSMSADVKLSSSASRLSALYIRTERKFIDGDTVGAEVDLGRLTIQKTAAENEIIILARHIATHGEGAIQVPYYSTNFDNWMNVMHRVQNGFLEILIDGAVVASTPCGYSVNPCVRLRFQFGSTESGSGLFLADNIEFSRY